VPSQVKCFESDLPDDQFVCIGVQSWYMYLHTVLLEHVEEGGLPGIIEAEEKDLGTFMVQALQWVKWGEMLV